MTLVVFTDLDGTLLDHETYSWAPAHSALQALKDLDIPLVLASSKTAAEIEPLQRELGLGQTPAIVENGAGLLLPGKARDEKADDYSRLLQRLSTISPDLRRNYRGFGEMTDQEVSEMTGLPLEQARLARKRRFTEPGIWHGSAADLAAFIEILEAEGIAARQGGRFLTLSFGRTKAQAMAEVSQSLNATIMIALGDAPNDKEMLETATYGVIVRNDMAKPLPELSGEAEGRIRRTSEEGPRGWNTAVCQLLAELGLKRDMKTHG